MIIRLRKAISKVLFCFNVSQDSKSFFKLLSNSKKFKRKHAAEKLCGDKADAYDLTLIKQNVRIFLRTYSGDLDIFYEIFWNKVYMLPGVNYENIKTIVDLGANIGLASLYFRHAYPNALIYPVEPETSNFDLLLKNLDGGIANKNIFPLHAAIDLEDGEATVQSGDLKYNSIILPKHGSQCLVRTLTMNTLVKEFALDTIDILKIDIEGSEKKMFEGDTTWMSRVRYILVEFHSASTRQFCRDVLVSKNFTMRPILTGNKAGNLFVCRAPAF